jgi:PPE-repeat protein
MAELRVNPADAGARLAAVLSAAASVLAAAAGIPPAPPPGMDPVSLTATNQVLVNSAQLSAHLAAAIHHLIAGAEAVVSALSNYVASDAEGAAGIMGSTAGSVAAALTDLAIPSPPVIDIPDLPLNMPAALATVPLDPAMVDDLLTAGTGPGGMEAHAAAWDALAAQLQAIASDVRAVGSTLPASWDGPAAQSLAQRLSEFGDWMNRGGESAISHASGVRQVGNHYTNTYNRHPRAIQVRTAQQELMSAASRGDIATAVAKENELLGYKERSMVTMAGYSEGAGTEPQLPGEAPHIAGTPGRRQPRTPGRGPQEQEIEDLGAAADPHAEGRLADPKGAEAGPASKSPMQDMGSLLSTFTQIPTQIASAAGQAMGTVGQMAGQIPQQASQIAGQLGSVLSGAKSPLNNLANTGDPLKGLGGGAKGGGAGGGGAGAGGTMPAGLPEQFSPAQPAAQPTTAPPAGVNAGATSGTGGMGMGMMPMGRGMGGEGAKALPRNAEWFPDEALVKDEAEVSEPVAGQRRRARPTET